MKLRTKLTVGMVVLLVTAMGLCCGVMIYKNLQLQEKGALSYTAGEEKRVVMQFEKMSRGFSGNLSERTKQSLYKYAFSEIALTSSAESEFVLQGPDEDIYNNSGIDAKAVLEHYGELKEESDGRYMYKETIIYWEQQYFCIVGMETEIHQEQYWISVVRNITDSMDEMKDLGVFCVGIGLFILILTAGFAFFYLKRQLRPLQLLEREANGIAEKYAVGQKAVEEYSKGSAPLDETGSLKRSFEQMQATVEVHISEVEKKVEEQQMLISALAHEMRTPVTAITGYAYVLKHAELTEEQWKEAVTFVDSESLRLERLSTKLTQLISMDHTEFAFSEIDLHAFGQRLKQTLQPKAGERDVRFFISVEEEEEIQAGIYGDGDLLMVLVTNLFDNACKAGAKEIQILLRDNMIEVIDNGSGMEEGVLDKIMQPFYQGDASRKQEGFGLGLAICKRIADLHNGCITVSSKPGRGTRFTIYTRARN